MGGSAVSLIISAFCGAVLIHGYIPMPVIICPVWLIATLLGAQARRARGSGGFPMAAWLTVATIMAVFSLPMVLDTIINPPGNIVAIYNRIIEIRKTGNGLIKWGCLAAATLPIMPIFIQRKEYVPVTR